MLRFLICWVTEHLWTVHDDEPQRSLLCLRCKKVEPHPHMCQCLSEGCYPLDPPCRCDFNGFVVGG